MREGWADDEKVNEGFGTHSELALLQFMGINSGWNENEGTKDLRGKGSLGPFAPTEALRSCGSETF